MSLQGILNLALMYSNDFTKSEFTRSINPLNDHSIKTILRIRGGTSGFRARRDQREKAEGNIYIFFLHLAEPEVC